MKENKNNIKVTEWKRWKRGRERESERERKLKGTRKQYIRKNGGEDRERQA